MSKSIERKTVATLDELLYGEIPNTALYSDKQEFDEASKIFEHEQMGKDFGGTAWYREWLLPKFVDSCEMAANDLKNYLGSDDKTKLKLVHEYQLRKHALDFLRGIVEDAQTFPRPIKVSPKNYS